MNAILAALIILMVVGALIAILTRNMLYAVISLGAVGFLLSIVFVFLAAPDLAITQIAVEVITLVILLQAVRRSTSPDGESISAFSTVAVLLLLLMVCVFGARMVGEFPQFGDPVTDRFADAPSHVYLQEGLEKTGAANSVTAVLLDFRAYDTLGEATVLFVAVLGALSIMSQRRKKSTRPGETESERQAAAGESEGEMP